MVLESRAAQRAAVEALAAHLAPGGVAAVDVWLPDAEDLARFDGADHPRVAAARSRDRGDGHQDRLGPARRRDRHRHADHDVRVGRAGRHRSGAGSAATASVSSRRTSCAPSRRTPGWSSSSSRGGLRPRRLGAGQRAGDPHRGQALNGLPTGSERRRLDRTGPPRDFVQPGAWYRRAGWHRVTRHAC